MLAVAVFLLQAAAPVPAVSAEALDLGVRLARTSGLAAVAPAMIKKDLQGLAAEDPSLNEAERRQLLDIGRSEAQQALDAMLRTIGENYARHLSVADLRVLVAHGESPAAARWRAAEPIVIAGAMAAHGELDLKKAVAKRFCEAAGKMCGRD